MKTTKCTKDSIEKKICSVRSSMSRSDNMTPREVRNAVLEDSYKRIISSKKASKRFLRDAGIIDSKGKLTSKYSY
jgi:hypothetical protein